MAFTLNERETYFRDRVRCFIDEQIRPRQAEHERQSREGDRCDDPRGWRRRRGDPRSARG
ncbi:hypothetical protein [Sphingomonas bacterium]|uniref:hypothetical protein n=1 Tax=Sphingomonas bacterium TaxID=1895847 RepID=UPI0015751182|nr:hypothetical protein [Sphingomonas bacterium]